MMAPRHILFVCTGNTCRSPMAEAIWNAHFGNGVIAASAGVAAWDGAPPQEHAVHAVKMFGGELTGHSALSVANVKEQPDWVLTMTQDQAESVHRIRPEWSERIWPLSQFVGETGDISDPIGQGQDAYLAVARRLHQLLGRLHHKLQEE